MNQEQHRGLQNTKQDCQPVTVLRLFVDLLSPCSLYKVISSQRRVCSGRLYLDHTVSRSRLQSCPSRAVDLEVQSGCLLTSVEGLQPRTAEPHQKPLIALLGNRYNQLTVSLSHTARECRSAVLTSEGQKRANADLEDVVCRQFTLNLPISKRRKFVRSRKKILNFEKLGNKFIKANTEDAFPFVITQPVSRRANFQPFRSEFNLFGGSWESCLRLFEMYNTKTTTTDICVGKLSKRK